VNTTDVEFFRITTADAAGFGATQLDRLSSAATAMSVMELPAGQVAVMSSVGSWFLTGVQQAARPNFRDYFVSSAIDQTTGAMIGRYPLAAPIINEFGKVTGNGEQADKAKRWVNENMEQLMKRSK
jgi:filamentous hemagglutinin